MKIGGNWEGSMPDLGNRSDYHMSVHAIDNQLVDSAKVRLSLENGG